MARCISTSIFPAASPWMRNRRAREGKRKIRSTGGEARTITDAITIFIRANVNAPVCCRRATGRNAQFDASAFKRKMDSPLHALYAVCASALLNNRYCCNPLGTRCRVSGSNCHACFKESRAFEPRRCQAPLYAALVPSVCISIIRCNNADCGVAR